MGETLCSTIAQQGKHHRSQSNDDAAAPENETPAPDAQTRQQVILVGADINLRLPQATIQSLTQARKPARIRRHKTTSICCVRLF